MLYQDEIDTADLNGLPARYIIPPNYTISAAVVAGVEDPADDSEPIIDILDTAHTPIRVIDEDAVADQRGREWSVDQIATVEVGGAYGQSWNAAVLGLAPTDVLSLPHPDADIPAVVQRVTWLTT